MFTSRLVSRAVRQLLARQAPAAAGRSVAPAVGAPHTIATRLSHHWSYRTAPPAPPKSVTITAEVIAAGMWWWILWHLWHEYEHITGEFEYPDASQWTDAELGIPADHPK